MRRNVTGKIVTFTVKDEKHISDHCGLYEFEIVETISVLDKWLESTDIRKAEGLYYDTQRIYLPREI